MKKENIHKNIPKNLPKELFHKILSKGKLKIERIVSKNHSTPKEKWYNQKQNEFVLVIKGSASLTFLKGKKQTKLKMNKGDYINIPAHLKHRVDKTDKETIWLVVFY